MMGEKIVLLGKSDNNCVDPQLVFLGYDAMKS